MTARLVECTFIAIGTVCMLAISTLRQEEPSGTDAALGQGIFAVYEWAFRIVPGTRGDAGGRRLTRLRLNPACQRGTAGDLRP